jgi:hypothetical protein
LLHNKEISASKKVLGEQEENMTLSLTTGTKKSGRSAEDLKDASSRAWRAYHSLDCCQRRGRSVCGGQERKKGKGMEMLRADI